MEVVCCLRWVKASWWDLSIVLGFPLPSSWSTNHISHHYWSLTQSTHSQIRRPTSVPVPLNCSLSWFSQPPMLTNLCSMFSSFLCHNHVLSHLYFAIMMILLTVSPTLVPLTTHSLFAINFWLTGPSIVLPWTSRYIIRIGCMDGVFFSFNIVGLSSPLLPCRLVDLRRGLLYSKNLQYPPSLSSHSTAPYSDCTSTPDLPFHRLECL